ncbi:MAG: 2Fe-2S iron-sulfur cluster-binding protein [Chloroflexia bacterium]
MATINVQGERRIDCADGRRLVLCIEDAGIDILHRCGGNARCTTCRVEILDGEPGPMNDRRGRDSLRRTTSSRASVSRARYSPRLISWCASSTA